MEIVITLLGAFVGLVLFNFLIFIPAQLLADRGLKKAFPKSYVGLNGKTGKDENQTSDAEELK